MSCVSFFGSAGRAEEEGEEGEAGEGQEEVIEASPREGFDHGHAEGERAGDEDYSGVGEGGEHEHGELGQEKCAEAEGRRAFDGLAAGGGAVRVEAVMGADESGNGVGDREDEDGDAEEEGVPGGQEEEEGDGQRKIELAEGVAIDAGSEVRPAMPERFVEASGEQQGHEDSVDDEDRQWRGEDEGVSERDGSHAQVKQFSRGLGPISAAPVERCDEDQECVRRGEDAGDGDGVAEHGSELHGGHAFAL